MADGCSEARGDGNLTASQTFTVAVLNADPATPVDTDPAANAVAENAAHGTVVGITAFATDPAGGP